MNVLICKNINLMFKKNQKVKKHCVRQHICMYSLVWPPSLGIYHRTFYLETAYQAQFQFSIWNTVSWRSLIPVILRERIQLFIPLPFREYFKQYYLWRVHLNFFVIFLTIWMPEMDISWLRFKACLDLGSVEYECTVPSSWKSPQKGPL